MTSEIKKKPIQEPTCPTSSANLRPQRENLQVKPHQAMARCKSGFPNTEPPVDRPRPAHWRRTYAEYVAVQACPRNGVAGRRPQLYAAITAEDTLSNCCGNLLSALGMELSYPEQAAQLWAAHWGLHRPTAADLGLTVPT
jgi:hypothetical protein